MGVTNPKLQSQMGQKSNWFTLMESQSVTADVRSDIQRAPFAYGIIVEVITSSGASTPSITPKLETVDDDGNSISLWSAAAAITTDTTTTYLFYPGAATDADGISEDADMPIPSVWRLFLDWTSGSFTAEVHVCYL